MAHRVRVSRALREQLARSLDERREPGAAELCDALECVLDGATASADAIRVDRLQKGVYRLRVGGEAGRTLVLKRHTPAIAHTDRLVVERWLPALGLGDRCPRLLAAGAQLEGRWVWHVYEDLLCETLADRRERPRLEAAVDLIAQLHTRGVGHPLLPEVRWHGRDHGARSLITNLRDGIAALEALATVPTPARFARAQGRLLERLHRLLEGAPRQVHLMDEAGGPDTLLHGDLGPKNVFVAMTGDGPRARIVDWDHVGVGPASYDLSTFLYQSSPDDRPWLLRRYRAAVERAGHRLAADGELNLLFHTAETARGAGCVIWPAMALLNDGAEWGRGGLADIEDWFETLRPPLPDSVGGAT
jgi:thiamine kinase-like enzyme